MPTDTKRQAVTQLAELLRRSSAVAVADYRGLKVSEMQAVRHTLRQSGVELHVTKNRLLKIAADEAGLDELKPMLEGPTALATVSGDATALARALAEALRPYARVVTVRGGLLGERAIDAGQLTRLATLPSREVLLGRMAGGMASPMTSMASVLAAPLRQLVGVLSAVADQRRTSEPGAGATAPAASTPAEAEVPTETTAPEAAAEAAATEAPTEAAEAPTQAAAPEAPAEAAAPADAEEAEEPAVPAEADESASTEDRATS